MSEMPNVIPGEDVESDWGNLIRDRTLQRYASEAVRTSQAPSPQDGELSYLADVNTVSFWDGAVWVVLGEAVAGGYLPLAGGTMAGSINMGGNDLTNADGVRTNFIRDINGNTRLRITSTGVVTSGWGFKLGVSGTNVSPALEFDGSPSTGFYLGSTNRMDFTAGGTVMLWLSPSGVYIRVAGSTGSAANAFLDGSNLIWKSTSARKYKSSILKLVTQDRRDFVDNPLPPAHTFTHDGDGKEYIGFIADELAEYDPRLGEYVDGEIENYDLRGVVAILSEQVRDLTARLDALS